MKAIVYTQYGTPDVLRYAEVEKPMPKDNEVLVKVHAASINAGDRYLLKGQPFLARLMGGGLRKPQNTILGGDIAGQVEAVGSKVTQFKPGDAVYGNITDYGMGGFAEYACAPEKALAIKPANLGFEEAAAVPLAGATALRGLRNQGKIQAGHRVLIHGASGGVGTFAVQLAKAFGAEVTGVCSARNVDRVRALGADHVIDYTKEDFASAGQLYDLILAVNGDRSIFDYRRALSPRGNYVVAGGSMTQIFQGLLLGSFISMAGQKKMTGMGSVIPNQADLDSLTAFLEAGKIVPVIDRCYPLNKAAEAFRYVEEVHAQGKVIISMAHVNGGL